MDMARFLLPAYAGRALIGVIVLALLATGSSSAVIAQDTDDDVPTAADCDVDAAFVEAPQLFVIDPEQSTASYTVDEELAGVGANTAIGTTNAILGAIIFDEDGTPQPCSGIAVDMRTLVSDSTRRDNFLRMNTLQSEQFPYTMFVIAAVDGLDGPIVEGETHEIELIGDLTIRDVTRSTTWNAEVTLEDGVLTGFATHTFHVDDFEIQKPIVASVVSIEDEIELRIELVATLAED